MFTSAVLMQSFHPKASVLKPAGWVKCWDVVPCAQGSAVSSPHGPLSPLWSSPSHPGYAPPWATGQQFFLFIFLLCASSNTTQNSPISPHPVIPGPDYIVFILTHHQGFKERQKKKVWLSSRRHLGNTFGLASARSCLSLQRGIWVVTASCHLCPSLVDT